MPAGPQFSNMLHRSMMRYLHTQAEKSLFRENALIDPIISKYEPTPVLQSLLSHPIIIIPIYSLSFNSIFKSFIISHISTYTI